MGEVISFIFLWKKMIFIENEVKDIECKIKIQISPIDTNIYKNWKIVVYEDIVS